MLADQHRTVQIDVENFVPYLLVDFARVSIRGSDTNVVVQDIDAPEFGDSGLNEGRAILLIADIGSYTFGVQSVLAQNLARLIQRADAAVCQQHLCTLSREEQRRSPAVAHAIALRLPGPGDHGHFSLQAHERNPSGWSSELIVPQQRAV